MMRPEEEAEFRLGPRLCLMPVHSMGACACPVRLVFTFEDQAFAQCMACGIVPFNKTEAV